MEPEVQVQSQETTADIQGEEAKVEQSTEQNPPERKGKKMASDRIREVIAQRNEAYDLVRELKTQFDEFKKGQAKPVKKEDFKSEEDYHRTLAREELKRIAEEADKVTRTQSEAQRQKQAKMEVITESLLENVESLKDSFPDAIEVIQASKAPMPEDLLEIIASSEASGKILYYLAKNPEQAERLANLPERSKDREILKLEIKLESWKPDVAQKKIATATATQSVGGQRINKDPSKMTDDEYHQWRKSKK